ncbi:addiction module toxin RelE [Duganella sp. FT135W]|uniref:Addiction module toxin RelE n=1 Tax=Duganella flavida TaxID=2692175 RepID=A0A6L8K435_9BURK|nr:transposase [Duganella flavida]MYM22269.1 addiction module toxin RelE [Duganella flavida]
MSRPLRQEFAGAFYHVMSRGDRQQVIYRDDTDRLVWLDMLASTCARFNFKVHGFCQMTNHYHLVVETGDPNLSHGMRQLNGQYSQYCNRRHKLVGHLFQGRYKAILVQKECYGREVVRYVVLNPVRAGMVAAPGEWRWSSYQLMVQDAPAPSWLETDWILSLFGLDREQAIEAYRQFVAQGVGAANPMKNVMHQLLLGDEAFVASRRSAQSFTRLNEVTKQHRRAFALTLAEYQAKFANRDEAITEAYFSTAYTMKEIAAHFRVSYRTVSRVVRRQESSSKAEAVYDWQN